MVGGLIACRSTIPMARWRHRRQRAGPVRTQVRDPSHPHPTPGTLAPRPLPSPTPPPLVPPHNPPQILQHPSQRPLGVHNPTRVHHLSVQTDHPSPQQTLSNSPRGNAVVPPTTPDITAGPRCPTEVYKLTVMGRQGVGSRQAPTRNPAGGFRGPSRKTILQPTIASINKAGGRQEPALRLEMLPRPKARRRAVSSCSNDMPRKDTVPPRNGRRLEGAPGTRTERYFVGRWIECRACSRNGRCRREDT